MDKNKKEKWLFKRCPYCWRVVLKNSNNNFHLKLCRQRAIKSLKKIKNTLIESILKAENDKKCEWLE